MTDPTTWWDYVSTGGALAIALLFLYLFQSGKVRSEKQIIETNSQKDQVVEVYTKIIEHKDKEIEWWRSAYSQQAERGDKQEAALRENMEMGRTMLQMLESISRVAERTPTAREKRS